jgi:DNA-binding transcriptional LysR family regulator
MAFDERFLSGIGVLSAIVDSGSFVGAAEILDMTQSGVSRAMARLEGRLGVRLLDRTTRAVTLTDEGRRFYERVMPLLGELEEAATLATGSAATVRGRLRVNMDPFFSRRMLGAQLGAFVERHPELRLELVTRDGLGDLVGEGFDLAIRFGQPPASSLAARRLLETRILTVAAPAYLERHGCPREPAELASHVCIHFRDPQTGRPFPWEFHRGRERLPVEVPGRLTVNDVATLHDVCRAGHGVAQVMAFGVEELLADGSLVELFPDWSEERFPLYALYPSRRHLPAKVRAFIDFVLALTGQGG